MYVKTDHLDAVVADGTHTIWLTVGTVFGLLFIALALLVRSASRRLRSQADALQRHSAEIRDSYRLLEQSSLETIETLNATVEVKDPCTAGHSHRVRAVSLLIGRELYLPPERLVGWSRLSHRASRRGHSARGVDRRYGGRMGRDDDCPPVRWRAPGRNCARTALRRSWNAVPTAEQTMIAHVTRLPALRSPPSVEATGY